MIDDDGDPIARSGVSFTLQVRESRDNGRSFEPTTISKQTGPDGGTQLTFRFTDPSLDPGDIAKLDLDIRNSSGFKVEDETTIGMVEDDRSRNDPFLDWADGRAGRAHDPGTQPHQGVPDRLGGRRRCGFHR